MTSTILVVVGTRPEAIKLMPVLRELKNRPTIRTIVVSSGQHQDMVRPVLEAAEIEIDYDLQCGEKGLPLTELTGRVIERLDALLTELRGGQERRTQPRLFGELGAEHAGRYPALMLVHGDTTTAFAASTVGMSNRLPVVHIEAGLRSGDSRQPYPEEFNRQLISRIAALHVAPTQLAAQALVREGIDLRTVYVSGNTSIDAVMWAVKNKLPFVDERLNRINDHKGPLIVATAHRRENWGAGLEGIVEGLRRIAVARKDSLIVVPMHLNPLVRQEFINVLSGLDNVMLLDPLDYFDFAKLLHRAHLAISDSGGVQEEAPSLGTPVLVTRAVSERPEGLAAGLLTLVGTDPNVISTTALNLLSDNDAYEAMLSGVNPFGDGLAAFRIAGALEHLILGTPVPTPFGPGFDRIATLCNAGFNISEVKAGIGFVENAMA